MGGFRTIDTGSDAIQFEDGVVVWMKRELSGWDRDRLRDHMLRLSAAGEVELHSGDRKALEMLLVRITGAGGKDVPITAQLLDSLDAETWTRLVEEANKRFRPLAPAQTQKQTGSPTTSSGDGQPTPPSASGGTS